MGHFRIFILLIAITCGGLVGCGEAGFAPLSSLVPIDDNRGQDSDGEDSTTPSTPSPDVLKLDLNCSVDGGNYDQEPVATFDKKTLFIKLRLPLPPVSGYTAFTRTFPEAPQTSVEVRQNSSGQYELIASLPIKVFLDSVLGIPTLSTLPNGSAIPGMSSGPYPALSTFVSNGTTERVTLYLGKAAVGLFVESSYFPDFMSVTNPVLNSSGLRSFGSLTIVPLKGTANGGLFLNFAVPNDIESILRNGL